ncbi:MAG: homocysteine S-methyltransferase family protein [Paracoccaceae bacterium]
MARYRNKLPQMGGDVFLTYTGMETDLLFTQGVDLPGFATFPLLDTDDGRALLNKYLCDLIGIARTAGLGVILESHTWVANRDRGAEIGFSPEALKDKNLQSIAFLVAARESYGDLPTLISANVGPRSDAYAPAKQMTSDEAEQYHAEQIGTLATTKADLISGYTLAYPEEAIGMVRAAQRVRLPVVIAFTVETDGCLPTGLSLGEAIAAVDNATDSYASYFMINCAHPDHFGQILTDAPWMARLKGIVANASRCSHAELDNADILDDGNPKELGQQLADIYAMHPNINILGGCCGTDMRHLGAIAAASTQR